MPEVKLTDDEITELEPWNRVRGYRDTADAAALKVAKACWQFLIDYRAMEPEAFDAKYGVESTMEASDDFASWLKGQGIEVTE